MPPTIGITRCSRLDDYIASVERAGARVRILEVSDSAKAVLGQVDGLLLTGGGDVDPAFFGEERHPSIQDAEPGRDELEIDLARRAVEANLPLLAICRGAQVLNVAMGGSLVQDIPSTIATELPHAVEEPKDRVAHDVTITPGSRLERSLGPAATPGGTCPVNSRHHQSVGRIGQGLTAVATAPDGIIEAIEAPEAAFCIGVQWHPENFWKTGAFSSLFESFVASARERSRQRAAH